jgi:Caspase domain
MTNIWTIRTLLATAILFQGVEVTFAQCREYEILNMRKTALIIGERSYKKGALLHTGNDANDMTDSLRKIGFKVYPYIDADKSTLDEAIDTWIDNLGDYQVALFYFSGHGCESAGGNYLFPLDANPKAESELINQCISANAILERMTKKTGLKYRIMLLDACRDNPFTKSWAKGGETSIGLSPMSGSGTYIGFAASPGNTASDGSSNDRNGLYTGAILKYITEPNETIDQIFTKVNAAAQESSSGDQVPYESKSLTADFCFSVAHKKVNETINPLFIQPASDLAISSDEEQLVVVENGAQTVSVLDANSFTRLSSRSFKGKILYAQAQKSAIVLDSSDKKISVLRLPSLDSLMSIPLPKAPSAIAISADEKTAYIACSDSVYIVNLLTAKILKTVPGLAHASGMVLSVDNRSLFMLSHAKTENYSLYVLDIRTGKIRRFPGMAFGTGIGLAPDGARLFASLDTLPDRPETNIIDVNSMKSIATVPTKAETVSFSRDAKYALLGNMKSISIIKVDSGLLIKSLSFFHDCRGIATTEDDRIIAWIEEEQRPMLIDLTAELKKVDRTLPDPRIQEFNRNQAKSLRHFTDSAELKAFNRIRDSVGSFPMKFAGQLEGAYGPLNGSMDVQLDYDSAIIYTGIYLIVDPHKAINMRIELKYDHGYIYISYTDQQDGQRGALGYKFHSENMEWDALNAKLQQLYLDRLQRLRIKDKTLN